jgi:hypothetical protein
MLLQGHLRRSLSFALAITAFDAQFLNKRSVLLYSRAFNSSGDLI